MYNNVAYWIGLLNINESFILSDNSIYYNLQHLNIVELKTEGFKNYYFKILVVLNNKKELKK